jgi:uncharacterized protein (DUF58 family)
MPPFFDEAFLRKLERLALLTRQAAVSDSQGERRSKMRGQSVEFADFRPYVPGDDIRRIDWNAYARLERFFIKLFADEQDLTLHLMLDTSRSMDWGQPHKLDYALRAAAAVGYLTLLGLDRVTIVSLDGPQNERGFPALRGKNRALELFDFLASLSSEAGNAEKPQLSLSGQGLARRLAAYAAEHTPGPVMLLSDLMDEGWFGGVNALAGRGYELTILHILAPDEIEPQLNGDYKLRDSESTTTIEITADFESLERYHQDLADWQGKWRRFASARGANYLAAPTNLPLEDLLVTHLRIQGVLR